MKMQHKVFTLSIFFLSVCLLLMFNFTLNKACGYSTRFSGVVVDTKGQPIIAATVRLQGTKFVTGTDDKGRFNLTVDGVINSKNITAWKAGFYNWGQSISPDTTEYRITLTPIPPGDNKQYKWIPPLGTGKHALESDGGGVKPCRTCHETIVKEWQKNAHANAAKNSLFLSFFNGAGSGNGKGIGYKRDFPNSNGNCATCHIPASALVSLFNSDPNKTQGVAKEGIFCDLCHKIKSVSIDDTGGYPGVLSIEFNRLEEGYQIFYGVHDDITSVNESSYNPLYKDSRYCAPCHNAKFWDLTVYSDFDEWAESSYAERNIHCQDCHMKPTGKMKHFAPIKSGGILRDPSTLPSHRQLGVKDIDFMRKSIELNTQSSLEENMVKVTVTVKNTGAGHHYPAGSPMRNMILLVNATDKDGKPLSMIEGEKVPVWGGTGDVEKGNYAGLPGKGFAKVLMGLLPYPDGKRKRGFRRIYPAPYWRPTNLYYDNRIAADKSDTSTYLFLFKETMAGPISIDTRLIYRRSYKNWLDEMGLEIPDIELARNRVTVEGR